MEQTFLTFLEISAASAVVILAVALLSSRINRGFTAKWKYWLWMVLAVRLLIPINPSFGSAPAKVEVSIPATPVGLPTALIAPVQPATPLPLQSAMQPATPVITTIELLMLVWLTGTVLFLIWQVVSYLRFRRQVTRWGLPVPRDSAVAAVRQQVEAEFEIGRTVPTLICKQVSSPMMIGFFRPLLLLPHEEYSAQDLSFILRHELTHYKRRDIWYKALMLFAGAVHWFNPAVWLMVREASRDLEISCDAAVMAGADMEQRRQYSETILACIHRELRVKTALSTHFYGGKKTLKERFANILSTKKRRTGAIAFVAVLLCGGIVGGLVACDTQRSADETALFQPTTNEGLTEREALLLQTQDRLTETLRKMENIEDAEVLLEEDGSILRASVSIRLRGGEELTEAQQDAIRNIVFSSVPDIEEENILLTVDDVASQPAHSAVALMQQMPLDEFVGILSDSMILSHSWEQADELPADTFSGFYYRMALLAQYPEGWEEPLQIPSKDYEDAVTRYFDVSVEHLRTAENYNAEEECYSFDYGIGSGGKLEIDTVEESGDMVTVSYRQHDLGDNPIRDGAVTLEKNGEQYKVLSCTTTALDNVLPASESAAFFTQDGQQLTALYTTAEGRSFEIQLTLPEGVTVASTGEDPDYETDSGLSPYAPILLVKDGASIGSFRPVPYGATDVQTLAAVRQSASNFPMPVYSPVVLSTMTEWNTDSLESYYLPGGNISVVCHPSVDGETIADCVLAYNLDSEPYFLYLTLEPGSLTTSELSGIAESAAFL